jgi:hypothetical protein
MFSLIGGVLLRPLVNRDENRLIYIRESAPSTRRAGSPSRRNSGAANGMSGQVVKCGRCHIAVVEGGREQSGLGFHSAVPLSIVQGLTRASPLEV